MSMPPLTIGAEEQLFSENVLASSSQNSPMAAAPASATLPASTNSNQIPVGNSTGTKVSSASGEGTSQVMPQMCIHMPYEIACSCEIVQLHTSNSISCIVFSCWPNHVCRNWFAKLIPPNNWTKKLKNCSYKLPTISWKIPSMQLACWPNIGRWPKLKFEMYNCTWREIGICGYRASVQTNYGHTNGPWSQKRINSVWLLYVKQSKSIRSITIKYLLHMNGNSLIIMKI